MHNFFFFQFVIKNIKVKKGRTIIFPFVLYGCETGPLTMREERRIRVSENRILRRIFGPKKDEVTGSGEDYIPRNFMVCSSLQILFGWLNQEE